MLLKIGLADDIVAIGHLFVGKNYSKRKQLNKLSDPVLICSRQFTENKSTKILPFLIRLHKWFNKRNLWVVTKTVNECFFQSGIDE